MKLTTQIDGNQATLFVDGLFQLDGVSEFRAAFDPLVATPAVQVIAVDLDRTRYIDSSALGVLLTSREATRKASKTIVLARVRGEVLNVVRVAHLDRLFELRS